MRAHPGAKKMVIGCVRGYCDKNVGAKNALSIFGPPPQINEKQSGLARIFLSASKVLWDIWKR
jgi:hypothetical protein